MMDRVKVMEALKTIVRPAEAKRDFTLMEALEYLDVISKDRRIELDGQIRHFLMNRSYEKALVWFRDPKAVEHTHS